MNKTGFGFLRLPSLNPDNPQDINYPLLNQMVDTFLEQGGRYFDTAYTYLNGVSEEAIRKSLTERHPRESFLLADKLPGYKVKNYEECFTYFQTQLNRCGVEFFDVYLLHWLNQKHYEICERYDAFRFLRELKAKGLAKCIGFSYHDGPELLERILTDHPEVDYVQLQLNYLDWDSEALQAARLYETALRHGKKVIVMEPVKGGSLVDLPAAAADLLTKHRPSESLASWAIRFASSLEQVEVVLSGMNTLEQIEDNMQSFEPLSSEEYEVLKETASVIRSSSAIPCTGCNYCAHACPQRIPISRYFSIYNDYQRNPDEKWKILPAYQELAAHHTKASDCSGCRRCEQSCPQKLGITSYLWDIREIFEEDV